MNTQSSISFGENPESRSIFLAGAVSTLLVIIGYIATFPVYALVGIPPKTGIEAQLTYFAANATGWWILTGLMIGTDLLLIPVFLALYHALKNFGRYMMMISLALVYLFIAFDISVTWTSFTTLIISGSKFAVATDTARTSLIAGAGYASAILESPIGGICAIFIPAMGVLLTSLVMLKGVFSKFTAYIGIMMGITGIAFLGSYFITALSVLHIINALLATAWYGFVCATLFRLYQQV